MKGMSRPASGGSLLSAISLSIAWFSHFQLPPAKRNKIHPIEKWFWSSVLLGKELQCPDPTPMPAPTRLQGPWGQGFPRLNIQCPLVKSRAPKQENN